MIGHHTYWRHWHVTLELVKDFVIDLVSSRFSHSHCSACTHTRSDFCHNTPRPTFPNTSRIKIRGWLVVLAIGVGSKGQLLTLSLSSVPAGGYGELWVTWLLNLSWRNSNLKKWLRVVMVKKRKSKLSRSQLQPKIIRWRVHERSSCFIRLHDGIGNRMTNRLDPQINCSKNHHLQLNSLNDSCNQRSIDFRWNPLKSQGLPPCQGNSPSQICILEFPWD